MVADYGKGNRRPVPRRGHGPNQSSDPLFRARDHKQETDPASQAGEDVATEKGYGMKRLWKHQQGMAQYAQTTQHPALFCQMRLGKTLVTVRVVRQRVPQDRRGLRVLLVMPGSCIRSWIDTLNEEGQAYASIALMDKKKRLALLATVPDHPGNIWVITNKEAHLAVPAMAAIAWDAVVLDESPFIRNPRSKASKYYVGNFRRVPMRTILTGTPNPESDLDYYQQLKFLGHNLLGATDFWKFRARYFNEIDYTWHPKPGVREAIQSWLSKVAYTLRRKDVQMEVRKVYELRLVTMPPDIRKLYKKLEKEFFLEYDGATVETKTEAAKWGYLRQFCDGVIEDKLVWDGKIRELIGLLEGELRGESVVVWFVYNEPMKRCHEELVKAGISAKWISGEHDVQERLKVTTAFSRKAFRVLCCQTKIATYGEDFSVADTAVFLGLPAGNLERMQVEERIVHLNKVNKTGVLIVDMVAEDSVDQDLYDLSAQKKHRAVSAGDIIRSMQERFRR